jgi:nicotinamidase/pyrazinamidase
MRIFYDVDTQHDFVNKDGALYVPDAELIKPKLKSLTKYALKKHIPIIGSVDRHFGIEECKKREGELARWGGPFPDHCMVGTKGEHKIPETTLRYLPYSSISGRYDYGFYVPHEMGRKIDQNTLDWAINTFETTQYGVYFEKQSYDVFTNPSLNRFLKKIKPKEAIVYGVATDICVKAAVLGMQKRSIQCYVVEDAIKGVDPENTKSALEEMLQAGAKIVRAAEVVK